MTFRQTQPTESLGALPQPPGLGPRWRSEPRRDGVRVLPPPRTCPGVAALGVCSSDELGAARASSSANVAAATAPQLVRLKECAVLINDM